MFTLTCGSLSVQLRNPDFQDIHRVNTNSIITKGRSGQILAAQLSDWPRVNIYKYTFQVFDPEIVEDFRYFVENTAGLEIQTIDHNSVTRSGYIITPALETITKHDRIHYEFTFEFQESVA